jgi:hypothetical protein
VQEHLKDLFDRALDDEPVFPDGGFVQQAMAQGGGIRRRRRALLIGGATAVAAAVVAVLNLTPAPAGRPPQASAAAVALMAQAEPQCTWSVSEYATDVGIFLRPDITWQQRDALRDALRADPLVRNLSFESHEDAYERFKKLWHDSPDFVASVDASQLPESFRLKLTPSPQYAAFAAAFAGRPGVQGLVGGVCP